MLMLLSLFLVCCLAKVRISEIVPHSDVEDGYYDYLELWNDDDKPADISGHFLTDAGSNPTKCQIKPGTILQPDEYRSFSFQAPGDVVALVADCPFRLSKANENCYYGSTDNGKANGNYTLLDNMNIGATMNRLSNSLWFVKDSKSRNMMTFPTENMPNRYPIVGPLSMQEVVWDVPAGKLQWIKVTCLYGQYPNTYTSACRMTNRQGNGLRLRLEQQKDMFTDTNAATPVSLSIPTDFTLPFGTSLYLTNGDPAAFRAMYANDPRLEPLTYVFGPWIGDLYNKTSKNVFCGISTLEHAWDWWVEQFRWKSNDTDYERLPVNGGLTKLSRHGNTYEPDNWLGLGQFLPCNLTAELPQSDCPTIDMCTAAQCVNVSGVGQCKYNSLACNHPNFDRCYPMQICKLPAPARYNGNSMAGGNPALGGCYITNQIFGHTTSDIVQWGMYPPYPESMWYNVGCTRQAIDCDLSKWGKWNYCPTCDARYNQTRTREIKTAASKNPDGKCAALSETRSCATPGASDIVCGRIEFKYVNWGKRWVDLYNPSTLPLDISDWVLRQGPCTEMNYPANDTYVDFKSNTILLPGDTIRKDLKNVVLHERGVKNNVICLHEVTGKGRFTGSWMAFDESQHTLKSLYSH